MDGMLEAGTTRMMARVEGPVGWMIFNNPARRNAVSLDMWAAVLAIASGFSGHDRLEPADFSVAFLVVAAMMLLAAPASRLMPADAGAEMSGHRHH